MGDVTIIKNSDSSNQFVLMVSYYYPPVEHAGTRRIGKFVKYLPEFGFSPIILTTKTRGILADDAENSIFRADDLLGIFKQIYRNFRLKDVPVEQRANIGLLPPNSKIQQWKNTHLIPDPYIIWYPFARSLGYKVLKKYPIPIIYSTSPPETNHLVALNLKKKTGLPWVADFRDGWMFEPLRPIRLTSIFRNKIEAKMEKSVLQNADKIIVVNDVFRHDLHHRFPNISHKISVITNGYDQDDFKNIKRQRNDTNTFRLVYTGSLSASKKGRSIKGLLETLDKLAEKSLDIMNNLEIILVGNILPAEVLAIQSTRVGKFFTFVGQVPYQQALQYQMDADVLLLVTTPAQRSISTSKLFEYLVTGNPILALSGQSAASEIVMRLKAGIVVEPNNHVEIEHALQIFYKQWQSDTLIKQINKQVHQFDRRNLTQKLANIFDILIT
ncbi:MAG: hypothetical protein B6242_15540 [Anaerolineaceae bacterium 4572_78]|nr:MAG: hypothetical protein B6242_15540 [Anaerolineaceae bacterium 4572_78]